MATVHIPAHWRDHVDGRASVEVPGRTLREVIEHLLQACPDLDGVLTDESGQVRSEIAVAINSEITENGLLEPVPEGAEIHLIPAISGGGTGPFRLRRDPGGSILRTQEH